jgi:hypothetical protein
MVGAEHHEKGTRSPGQVAAASCAVAPEPSAGRVASNVASCAAVRSCKPATAASASVSAAASSKASSACPRMSQHHHRIHRLRAAVLHQGIFSRRERQSAGGAAPHQHEICQLRGGDPSRPVLRRPTTNFTRPRTRSSNPVPSSGESRKPSVPARVVLGLARRATSPMRVGAPTRFLKQDGNISKCPHSEILLVGPFLGSSGDTHRRGPPLQPD